MARKTVFPLSDDVVRHILRGITSIKIAFPDTSNTRPFLAAFLTLVYEASGKIYGATTYRKLLQTFAPEYRPGTATIQSEISRLRRRLNEQTQFDRNDISSSGDSELRSNTEPGATALLTGIDRLANLLGSLPTAQQGGSTNESTEVLQIVESECRRLQEHNTHLQNQLSAMYKEREEIQAELAALRAERDTFHKVASEQREEISKLAAAVELAQARVADSHRFALGRIENASAETRMWQERARELEKEVEIYKKKATAEREFADSLRRALSAERGRNPAS